MRFSEGPKPTLEVLLLEHPLPFNAVAWLKKSSRNKTKRAAELQQNCLKGSKLRAKLSSLNARLVTK